MRASHRAAIPRSPKPSSAQSTLILSSGEVRPSASNAAGSCGGDADTGRANKREVSSVYWPSLRGPHVLRCACAHSTHPATQHSALAPRRRPSRARPAACAQAAGSRGAWPRDQRPHVTSPFSAAALAPRPAPRARELSPVRPRKRQPDRVCACAHVRRAHAGRWRHAHLSCLLRHLVVCKPPLWQAQVDGLSPPPLIADLHLPS